MLFYGPNHPQPVLRCHSSYVASWLRPSDSVELEYHLAGSQLSLRRLQSKTNTSSVLMSALLYADDASFPILTADGLQCILDVVSETYIRAGLIVNTTKAEILSASTPDALSLNFF